jgi:hypothetical protein
LKDFSAFQAPLLLAKHQALEVAAVQARGTVDFQTCLMDLRLYRAQYRRILASCLYFLKIDNGRLYKIGVTTRHISERVHEVRQDLQAHLGDVGIDVIGTWPAYGNLELYFKYRYQDQNVRVGVLTEYFAFANVSPVLLDLENLPTRRLTRLEEGILAGELSDLENTVRLEEIERRRKAAIKTGMRRAARRGKHIGRPPGRKSPEDFLAKPTSRAATDALANGLSLREAARVAGVAINKIRKVKRLSALLERSRRGQ